MIVAIRLLQYSSSQLSHSVVVDDEGEIEAIRPAIR
jgi:hypothetical protein